LDVIPNTESGLLVYTVDMKIASIRGGWKVVRPARSTSPTFDDAALQVGESVEVQGIKLTVVSKSDSQLNLRIN
jgi:riboflavin synthase alpha subunit